MLRALHITSLCAFGLIGTAAAAEDWSFKVTPYIWAPSLDTSLDIGSNPPVEGSKSIFDVLDGAFLITGEARRNNWAILGEFNYLNLADDFGISPGDPIAGWRVRGTMVTLGAARTFVDTPNVKVEALGALRRWDMKPSTTVLDTTVETKVSWTDPIVGFRLNAPVGERTQVSGMANIGGFGVGSERQWEVLAAVEWQATDLLSLSGGYRHLDIRFEDSTIIDLQLSGPFIAASFNF